MRDLGVLDLDLLLLFLRLGRLRQSHIARTQRNGTRSFSPGLLLSGPTASFVTASAVCDSFLKVAFAEAPQSAVMSLTPIKRHLIEIVSRGG
jgi:hypothetical protein